MSYSALSTTILILLLVNACQTKYKSVTNYPIIQPLIITEPVPYDSDDPAIWINFERPAESLIIGTDKGSDKGKGGLYVFTLDGKMDTTKSIFPLNRPNNVDVAYGLKLGEISIDVAVVTVREDNKLRIYKLPEMIPVDNGGIPVFEGESERSPMGVALFTDQSNGNIYAIVSRKFGPKEGYLWQYHLIDSGFGFLSGNLVRTFGTFSGKKEIEAIAVDNELGYVYYSDETIGVRKYFAHPDSTDRALTLFATSINKEDHEGISIYKTSEIDGFLLLSDQQAQQFHIFKRQSSSSVESPKWIKTVKVAALDSDGSDATSTPLGPNFPQGIFVAMSADRTFHIYKWEDIIK